MRTLAPQTPMGWRPPQMWTPPAQAAAASVPLRYGKAQRKAKIGVIISLVGALALTGGIIFLVGGMMKGEAYDVAMKYLRANEEVRADLGKPIEEGLMPTGSIKTGGGSGSANLNISLSGPKGDGDAQVSLFKTGEKWSLVHVRWSYRGKSVLLCQARDCTITKTRKRK